MIISSILFHFQRFPFSSSSSSFLTCLQHVMWCCRCCRKNHFNVGISIDKSERVWYTQKVVNGCLIRIKCPYFAHSLDVCVSCVLRLNVYLTRSQKTFTKTLTFTSPTLQKLPFPFRIFLLLIPFANSFISCTHTCLLAPHFLIQFARSSRHNIPTYRQCAVAVLFHLAHCRCGMHTKWGFVFRPWLGREL